MAKKKDKQSITEIMDEIIDKEALEARKAMSKAHLPKKVIKPVKTAKNESQWWEKPMTMEDFIKKEGKKGAIYVQHKEWKPNIFIGPYDITTADRVISDYIKNSKKAVFKRKPIKDLHSILIEDYDSLKPI